MTASEPPMEYPIDGILDLHTFRPEDVKALVPEYLQACLEKHIFEVRIIHGKGTGTLRRIVHAQLERSAIVAGYRLAGESEGGWGATIVRLEPPGAQK